ncbi:MAG: hypothetical protein K1X87_07930 [Dehalococcoidia bacterium]|nr:hypothetical protein [Dehalococcoidia bacterium]HRC62669.1 hypothetical protein [Dehalococcoidia bacterium]
MRIWSRVAGAGLGALLALLPIIASAEEGSRVLERGDDWNKVMILTFATLLGVMFLATLGFLYRMKRHLFWDFQQPAAPHDDHH